MPEDNSPALPPYSNTIPEDNSPALIENLSKPRYDPATEVENDASLRFGPFGSPEIQENVLPVGLAPPAGVEYESEEDYVTG